MRDITTVIHRPIVTEKNMDRVDTDNAYTFEVDGKANRVEVRKAVEALFKVRVLAVRTQNYTGKPKRAGMNWHRAGALKKAIVKVHPEDRIDIV